MSDRSARGVICLQGGRELTPPCASMDSLVLAAAVGRRRAVLASSAPSRSARPGTRPAVAVLAGAARVGSDYAGASERATRHYDHLRAEVRVVPDPRTNESAALEALDDGIDLLVLPGGSPSSLREVLTGDVQQRVLELHGQVAMGISGASAGAMVLCTSMRRPDAHPPDTVGGLGLVGGTALVHWQQTARPPDAAETYWALPECGGVLLDPSADGLLRRVGQGDATMSRNGVWVDLPRADG